MIKLSKIFVAVVILMLPTLTFGQHCKNFHKSFCASSPNKFFKYNGQSRSALFAKGQTSELTVVVYGKQDYAISICTEQALGDQVEWKILDAKSRDVLYSNADDGYAQTFEFSSQKTRKLILSVSIPDGETKSKKRKPEDMACLGLLIEHMQTPKSGF